jgi:hypothetical protein
VRCLGEGRAVSCLLEFTEVLAQQEVFVTFKMGGSQSVFLGLEA